MQMDFKSRTFRIALSIWFVWLTVAAPLCWAKWQDAQPDESGSSYLKEKCFDERIDFRKDEILGNRRPNHDEVQACLDLTGQTIEQETKFAERQALISSIYWLAIWGFALPIVSLILISTRSFLYIAAVRLGQAYWSWVNGGRQPPA